MACTTVRIGERDVTVKDLDVLELEIDKALKRAKRVAYKAGWVSSGELWNHEREPNIVNPIHEDDCEQHEFNRQQMNQECWIKERDSALGFSGEI